MTDTIGVAMLGYAFMGKAHSRAFREAAYLEPALQPRLVSISGRTAEKVEEARRLHGWEEATTDWREQVADERVQLFDNGGPNDLHAEPTIEAARNGKHVLCEKPLGRSAEEAHTIWRAAEEAGVVHMCGFNYRFVPAVRLAREIVESGDLGELFHFRARYLQSWGVDAPPSWRFDKEAAGSGALGDLGAHIVDLGRYLIGEPAAVGAVVRTFIEGHEVDDSFAATVEFEGGVVGTLEASRLATGRINQNTFEINGSRGSVSLRRRAPERAPGGARALVRARPRHGARPSLHGLLVAARPHRRLGGHLHPRGSPPPGRDRGEGDRRSARRDLRGRLPLRGDLRCHRPLVGERQAGGDQLPMKTSLGIWAFGPMATRFVPGGYQPQWAGRRQWSG